MGVFHVVDSLFGIYSQPLKRQENLIGLVVYSQVFKANQYQKSCQVLNEWICSNKILGGIHLFEFARGPENSFDFLYPQFPELFDSGSSLVWAGGVDGPLGDAWVPPQETTGLVDDRGNPLAQSDLIALIS